MVVKLKKNLVLTGMMGVGKSTIGKILAKKLDLLKLYKSEQDIINQIKDKNGDWFKDNNDTNYIEYEEITKYNPKKDKNKFIPCYEK